MQNFLFNNFNNLSFLNLVNKVENIVFSPQNSMDKKPNLFIPSKLLKSSEKIANKQNFLFSDIKIDDNPRENKINKSNNILIKEINQNQNNKTLPFSITFREIEYIQSRSRNLYSQGQIKSGYFVINEFTNFVFDNNHHTGYENEIERVSIFFLI